LRERAGRRLHEAPNLMECGPFKNCGQRKAAEAGPRRREGFTSLAFTS
jgi:hypothetical protein